MVTPYTRPGPPRPYPHIRSKGLTPSISTIAPLPPGLGDPPQHSSTIISFSKRDPYLLFSSSRYLCITFLSDAPVSRPVPVPEHDRQQPHALLHHVICVSRSSVMLLFPGRYLFLNAIANQLRYPNSHTHYFSCSLLYLFAEANTEAIQEQITRWRHTHACRVTSKRTHSSTKHKFAFLHFT